MVHNTKNVYSEAHLVIEGSGEQKILSEYFDGGTPSEVFVNEVKYENCSKTCYLLGDKSNITLSFHYEINSCHKMFYYVDNMIEIDLSNFDFSKVESFKHMFY